MANILTPQERRLRAYQNAQNNKLEAQRQQAFSASVAAPKVTPAQDEDDEHWLARVGATIGDIVSGVGFGVIKTVEGIADIGATAVGAIGELFGADGLEKGAENFASYDFTSDLFGRDDNTGSGKGNRNLFDTQWGNELMEKSYLDEDSMIRGIAEGVGGMLPSVAITVFSGGTLAPLASATVFGGAAGSSAEEALNEGASSRQSLGYGAVMGGVELATEKLGGKLVGGADDLAETVFGKFLINRGWDKAVSRGVGKALYTFGSEGLEEVASDLIDPLAKSAFDVGDARDDYFGKNAGENWGEVLKGLPKTFAVGGATGSLIGGLNSGIRALQNRDKGGTKYNKVVDAMTSIENVERANVALKRSGKATQEQVDAFETRVNGRVKESVAQISETMQKMSETQRARALEAAPILQSFIESDGTVNAEFDEMLTAQIASGKATNTTARIYQMSEITEGTREAVEAYNRQHAMTDGTEIRLYDGTFSETERQNFAKIADSIKNFGDKAGVNLNIAVVESNRADVNAFRRGNTVFLTREQLASGDWVQAYTEEIGHFTQGSKSFQNLAKFLAYEAGAPKTGKYAAATANGAEAQFALGKNGVDRSQSRRYNKKQGYIQITKQEYGTIRGRIMEDNSWFMARDEELPRYGTARSAKYFYVYENLAPGNFGVLKKVEITDNNKAYIESIQEKIGEKNNGESAITSTSELNRVLEILKNQARRNRRNYAHDSEGRADRDDGGISVGESGGDGSTNPRESNGDSGTVNFSLTESGENTAQEAGEGAEAPTLSKTFYEARQAVLDAGYGVSEEEIDSAWEKAQSGEQMTENEELAYKELTAKMVASVLGNEASIRRMARDNSTLAKSIFNRIRNAIEVFTGTNASRAEIRKLRRAELMFEEALDEIRERNKQAEKAAKRLSRTRDKAEKYHTRAGEYADRELAHLKEEYQALDPADREAWLDAHADVVDREEFEELLNAKQDDKTIHFSLMNSDSLSQNVDRVLNMSDEEALRNKAEANFISIVKETPSVITKNVSDAENLEVIMRFDAFYLATRHNGALDGHYHNYGDIMKKLPEIIADPEAIIRMDNDRLNLLSRIQTPKGNNSVVSIELNTVKDINSTYKKYNLVVSMIPSKDNYVRNNLSKHGIKVEYQKEDLSQVNPQLYEWLAIINDRSSNDRIPDNSENVKRNEKNNSEKPQFSLSKAEREKQRVEKQEKKLNSALEKASDKVVTTKGAKSKVWANYNSDKVFDKQNVAAALNELDMTAEDFEDGVLEEDAVEAGEKYDYKNYSASDYYTNSEIYSYDFLISQKDMSAVKLPETGALADQKGKIDDEKVLSEGRKNALSEGVEREGKIYVKNAYTDRELRIDNSTIKHGLDGTYNHHLTNARISSVIGSVVKNAIPINGLKNTAEKAKGTYAMASFCYDSKQRQFIAIVTVEEHTGNIDSFELYDVAHAISGRQKKGSQVDTKSPGVYPIEATTISIAHLLEIVNSTHKSILSNDVLEHFGEKKPANGSYSDKVLFSLSAKKNANVNLDKVYTQSEAKHIVKDAVNRVLYFGDLYGALQGKALNDVSFELFKRLNTTPPGKRLGMALDVSDMILRNAVVKETEAPGVNEERELVALLKPYLHKLDLDGIRGEISHKYDKDTAVYRRWEKQKDEYGMTPEAVAEELIERGYQIEAENPADIFFAIDEAYMQAVEATKRTPDPLLYESLTDEEKHQYQQSLTREIMQLIELRGTPSKLAKQTAKMAEKTKKAQDVARERIKEAEQTVKDNKAETRARIRKVKSEAEQTVDSAFRSVYLGELIQKLNAAVKGRFYRSYQFDDPLFRGSIESIYKSARRGRVSATVLRSAFGNLSQWYTIDGDHANPLLQNGFSKEDKFNVENSLFVKEIKTWLDEVAAGSGELSAVEAHHAEKVLQYFRHFLDHYHKVCLQGEYVDAEPIAREFIDNIRLVKRTNATIPLKIMSTGFMRSVADPISLMRAADQYNEKGFYTQMFQNFQKGALDAAFMKMELTESYDDFFEKHKKYADELRDRTIEYMGRKIPLDQAIALYMTGKRKQAQAGLVRGGIRIDLDKKRAVKIGLTEKGSDEQGFRFEALDPFSKGLSRQKMSALVQTQNRKLYDQFSDVDKAYIEMMEATLKKCAEIKIETDKQRLGYTNVAEDDYYFPIIRAEVAKGIDNDSFLAYMDRVSNLPMNKSINEHAAGELMIQPASTVFLRHVNHISMYANLAVPTDTFNRLYNFSIEGVILNKPVTVKSESSQTSFGKNMNEYLFQLKKDIEGISSKDLNSWFNKTVSFVRSGYAKAQLGGNPKVLLTQFSSFIAASDILDYDSIVKGFGVKGAWSEVDKYCKLAKLRHEENGAARAQGVLDKTTGKLGDVLMKGIGFFDRIVVTKLFGACQVQVQKNGGAKLGTEENKVAAGELLLKVILETQQNALATERSGAMRSGNELLKSFTMFSADSMKVLGRLLDAYGEVSVLRRRLQTESLSKEARQAMQAQLKRAHKKARRATATLVASSLFMAAIAFGFRWWYRKEEEKTMGETIGDISLDLIGNMMGGLPLIRDIYSFFADGYELDNFMLSTINDLLLATKETVDMSVDVIQGKEIARKDIVAQVRKSFYAAGQLFGIPVRNVYNFVSGNINRFFPETGYALESQFYSQNYRADLARAIENEDDEMLATIAGLMLDENVGGIESSAARKALNELLMAGYDVLPSGVPDDLTLTYKEEEYEVSAKDRKTYKAIYLQANDALGDIVKLGSFKDASQEAQEGAINFLYSSYKTMAKYEILEGMGVELEEYCKVGLFAEAMDLSKLAVAVATARTFESDTDRQGKVIAGSKKKKVVAYIKSLNLTAVEKYMVMGYLGYTNTNGKAAVTRHINSLDLTKSEKLALLEWSGYPED